MDANPLARELAQRALPCDCPKPRESADAHVIFCPYHLRPAVDAAIREAIERTRCEVELRCINDACHRCELYGMPILDREHGAWVHGVDDLWLGCFAGEIYERRRARAEAAAVEGE